MGLFSFLGKKKKASEPASGRQKNSPTQCSSPAKQEITDTDKDEALYRAFQAAARGDKKAAKKCHELYRDAGTILKRIWEQAEAGDAEAEFLRGYLSGSRGSTENILQGIAWYEKAARQGHAAAQCRCGEIYARGYGINIPMDREKAFYWYEQSAQQGYAEAQFQCSGKYESGIGVKRDLEKCLYWREKAAQQGHVEAQYRLGKMYEYGPYKDEAKALYWLEQAARMNSADAQYHLGCIYADGRGIEIDKENARYWLLAAARNGNSSAAERLDDGI